MPRSAMTARLIASGWSNVIVRVGASRWRCHHVKVWRLVLRSFFTQQPRLGFQLSGLHCPSPREWRVRQRDDDELVLRKTSCLQLARRQRAGHDCHVQIVARDPFCNGVNRADLKPQIVARVFGSIPGEQRGKQVETRRRRRPQANAADGPARDFLHAFMRAVDGPENASRLFQEDFTGDRQRHAARGTIQELRADLLLEQRNLV